jgi:hypothetical protein
MNLGVAHNLPNYHTSDPEGEHMPTLKISALTMTIVLVCVFVFSTALFSQTGPKDIVYLKNGSTIKGFVLEQIPNETVKIQTTDGNIYVFKMSEVERIVKETTVNVDAPSWQVQENQSEPIGGVTIFGGLLVPTGKFAGTSGDQAGLAKLGFTFGMEYSGINARSLYYAPGVSYCSNKVDETALRQTSGIPSTVTTDISSWTAIVPSVALGFGASTGNVRPFIGGILGIGFCSSPKMSFSYAGTTASQGSVNATAVAYGAVAGIKTTGSFNLSIRYVTMTPKFKISASGGGLSTSGEFEQPMGTLQAIAGISF